MTCDKCEYNSVRMCGKNFCMLPRCIYQERGGGQGDGKKRKR